MTATPDSFPTPQQRQLASELAQLRPAAVTVIRPETIFYQAGFAAAQAEFAANDRRRRRGALALAVCVAAAVTIPVSFYAGQTSVLSTTTARIDSPPPAAETESRDARINTAEHHSTAQPSLTPRSVPAAPALASDDTATLPRADATTGPYQAVFADWLQRLAHSTSPPWDETAPIASPPATTLVAFHRGGVIDVSNPHWSETLWTSTPALYRNPTGTQADQQATGQTRSLAVGDLNQLAERYRIAQ